MEKIDDTVLKVIAWVCFALALLVWDVFAIIGIGAGYILYKQTGEKAPMYANIGVLVFAFVIGFMIGLMFL